MKPLCDHSIRKTTWIGLLINVFLSAAKISVGLIGRSQALIADGVHSLSDLASDLMILIGVRYWTKPADACHPHGHRRIETVVALSIGALLIATAIGMLINAGRSLMHPAPVPAQITLVAAALSLILKEALYHYTIRVGRHCRSVALQANAWHHRTDALSSIPVLLAVGAIRIRPEWSFLDPIAAITVVFFIFQAGYRIVKPSIQKLVDSSAPPEVIDRIQSVINAVSGVRTSHNIRTRYVSDSDLAVDLHIQVDGFLTVQEGHQISHDVRRELKKAFPDISDVIVHIEPSEL